MKKITKIDQLRTAAEGEASVLVNILLKAHDHIEVITSDLYVGREEYSEDSKNFKITILDIANINLQLSDKNVVKCISGLLRDNILFRKELEGDIEEVARNLSRCPYSASTEKVNSLIRQNLEKLEKIKDLCQSSHNEYLKCLEPSSKYPNSWAPGGVKMFSAALLLSLGLTKFLPRSLCWRKKPQAFKYIYYIACACVAVSSAVLLFKAVSGLKQRFQDKSSKDKSDGKSL